MKRVLGIIVLIFTLLFATTAIVSADTTITKVDTDSGNFYAEFDSTPDWFVIKQATGALIWINDGTKYDFTQVKELAISANPSLAHGVNYWGIITGFGVFTKAEGDFQLPLGFRSNPFGEYWFMEALEDGKFYIDLTGVSNITYSYTDPPVIDPPPVDPPDKPDPPTPPTPPEEPTKDHSPQTGDMDYQTLWILGLMGLATFGMAYNYFIKK